MNLKVELQRTLSFIEPMNMEMIYLDISSEYLLTHKSDTIEDLEKALIELIREKKIKVIMKENHKYWIKIYPKRSLLKQIQSYFLKR